MKTGSGLRTLSLFQHIVGCGFVELNARALAILEQQN